MAHQGNTAVKATDKRRSWTSRGGSTLSRQSQRDCDYITVTRDSNLCGYVPVLSQKENHSSLQNADSIDTGSVTATRVDSVFVTLIFFTNAVAICIALPSVPTHPSITVKNSFRAYCGKFIRPSCRIKTCFKVRLLSFPVASPFVCSLHGYGNEVWCKHADQTQLWD
jgi:hypothetical protein